MELRTSKQSQEASENLSNLTYEVETSFDKLEDIRSEWDTFLINVGGAIYLSYDWCKLWWNYYGKGSKLQIILFRNNTALVGIIPLFIDTVWLGPIRLRIARIIGSHLPPKISDIPVHEDWAKEIFDKTLTHIIGEDLCDVICLGPLSGTYSHMEHLREVCLKRLDLIKVNVDEKRGAHTIFSLPDNYDAYMNSLSKKERTKCKYEIRLLQKTFDIKLDIVTNEGDIEKEFSEFCRLHDQQWQSQGFRGHFGAWPKAELFNLDLTKIQGKLGRLRLFRLIANGLVVAYQYTYRFGDCYHWRLTARELGSEWDRFSLGRVGLCTMIEYAIKEGVKKIEGGLGHYDYKLQLGAEEYFVQFLILSSKRKGVQIRFYFFSRIAMILNLIYYKIWVSRISPHLPIKKSSLWHLWIRSQI